MKSIYCHFPFVKAYNLSKVIVLKVKIVVKLANVMLNLLICWYCCLLNMLPVGQ